MLQSVSFKNFKAFRSLSVPLSPFTVIVGPNGVGKSTVLDGIFQSFMLGSRHPNESTNSFCRFGEVFQAPEHLVRKPDAQSFAVELVGSDESVTRMTLSLDAKGALAQVEASHQDKSGVLHSLSIPGDPNPLNFLSSLGLLNEGRVLRFWPDVWALRRPSLAADAEPLLLPNGAGLPGVIDFMLSQRDGSIDRVEDALRKLVPSFSRIHIQGMKLEWHEKEVDVLNGQKIERQVLRSGPGRALELEFDRVGRIPAMHISEGTLLALAILTAVHSPAKPTLFLLDDLDRALHPTAQLELVRLLKSIVQDHPGLQILTTAHAPMVIAACEAQDVVRLDFAEDGCPRTLPATGDPLWMTPSEIMSAYFGVFRTGAAELVQRYALLAGDALRTDAEDQELRELFSRLRDMNAEPSWQPVARARA